MHRDHSLYGDFKLLLFMTWLILQFAHCYIFFVQLCNHEVYSCCAGVGVGVGDRDPGAMAPVPRTSHWRSLIFPFNLHLLLSHALSWVGSQADFNHFTVFCRCKGHVACLPGYEAGQLETLRQVFPCTRELWCCKKGPRRQMGSRSDQVCQIWHDFIP